MDKIKTEGERVDSTLEDNKEYLIVDDDDGSENEPYGGTVERYDIERDED